MSEDIKTRRSEMKWLRGRGLSATLNGKDAQW